MEHSTHKFLDRGVYFYELADWCLSIDRRLVDLSVCESSVELRFFMS